MKYYCCYRVDSNSSSNNQYEEVNSSGETAVKKLIQAKYFNSKISWVHAPAPLSKKPSWYKG